MGKNTPERKGYIMENLVVTVGGVRCWRTATDFKPCYGLRRR